MTFKVKKITRGSYACYLEGKYVGSIEQNGEAIRYEDGTLHHYWNLKSDLHGYCVHCDRYFKDVRAMAEGYFLRELEESKRCLTLETEQATMENTIEIPVSDQYEKNFRGISRYHGPCVVCGKDVKVGKYWLIEVGGGGTAALPGSPESLDEDDAGFMGEQPIGPDCLKNHPELKPYVVTH